MAKMCVSKGFCIGDGNSMLSILMTVLAIASLLFIASRVFSLRRRGEGNGAGRGSGSGSNGMCNCKGECNCGKKRSEYGTGMNKQDRMQRNMVDMMNANMMSSMMF